MPSSRADARKTRKESKEKATSRLPLTAKTESQARYLQALAEHIQVFCVGPAGTGKTYLAARWAIRQVLSGAKERVVIARPTAAKPEHRMGFLPGGPKEKQEPWLLPVLDAIRAECSAATMEQMQKAGKIEFASFEHMRGRTFLAATVILDEAQNCTTGDLQMFLTRIGEGSQVVVCGDPDQSDIERSGLASVVGMIARHRLTAAVLHFHDADVVRSSIAAEWVAAFRAESGAPSVTRHRGVAVMSGPL